MENLKYTEILQKNKELTSKVSGPLYRVTILSNITVNSLSEILQYGIRLNNLNPEIVFGNFDNIVQDSANCKDSNLVIIFFDALSIIDNLSAFFDSFDDSSYDDLKSKLLNEVDIIWNNLRDNPVVIFNKFSSAFITQNSLCSTKSERLANELNQYLLEKRPKNTSLVDIDKIVLSLGVKASFDQRLYLSSKAPYTLSFLKSYTEAINPVIRRNSGKLKKAIIFDCDNTLWKGIIGEDGLLGIDMSANSPSGRPFHKVQQIAVFLSKVGVIVGLCSKNNGADVDEVLTKHEDTVLKEDNIVIKKVNWEDKAANLKSIADELNIGVDSLIFVDDSSFEINLIKELLPDVLCVQVPTNLNDYPELVLKTAYSYLNLDVNKEDLKKTEIYKQQFKREDSREKFESVESYLASLQIQLSVSIDDLSVLSRVTQLTQKTNQFNLTTRRYTEGQIQKFMENDNSHVFAATVNDRFGASGLTAVCIVKRDSQNPQHAFIDTLLMSCRIIGRNIEFALVRHILCWLKEHDFHFVHSEFVPTKKNDQVQKFYDGIGFQLIRSAENSNYYSMDISKIQIPKFDYINISNEIFTKD